MLYAAIECQCNAKCQRHEPQYQKKYKQENGKNAVCRTTSRHAVEISNSSLSCHSNGPPSPSPAGERKRTVRSRAYSSSHKARLLPPLDPSRAPLILGVSAVHGGISHRLVDLVEVSQVVAGRVVEASGKVAHAVVAGACTARHGCGLVPEELGDVAPALKGVSLVAGVWVTDGEALGDLVVVLELVVVEEIADGNGDVCWANISSHGDVLTGCDLQAGRLAVVEDAGVGLALSIWCQCCVPDHIGG